MIIDVNQLKSDIQDYFGTAMVNAAPAAIMNLKDVNRMSDTELCNVAERIGIDLTKYQINHE